MASAHARTDEDLKASICYSVAQVCESEASLCGVDVSPAAAASLAEFVHQYLTGAFRLCFGSVDGGFFEAHCITRRPSLDRPHVG